MLSAGKTAGARVRQNKSCTVHSCCKDGGALRESRAILGHAPATPRHAAGGRASQPASQLRAQPSGFCKASPGKQAGQQSRADQAPAGLPPRVSALFVTACLAERLVGSWPPWLLLLLQQGNHPSPSPPPQTPDLHSPLVFSAKQQGMEAGGGKHQLLPRAKASCCQCLPACPPEGRALCEVQPGRAGSCSPHASICKESPSCSCCQPGLGRQGSRAASSSSATPY